MNYNPNPPAARQRLSVWRVFASVCLMGSLGFLPALAAEVAAVNVAEATNQGPAISSFARLIYPYLQHERCISCHQFNSRGHNGRAYFSHRGRYLCAQCHTDALTGMPGLDWMAPPPKMDYTELSPEQVCAMFKRNSGSGNIEANLLHHMLHDRRIRWALDSGCTPAGPKPTVPGGYMAWKRDVQAWAATGMRCD